MPALLKFFGRRLPWIETAFVLLLLLLRFCTGIGSVPFHPDESQWISTSDYFESFVSGQFSSPVWSEQYWTLTQPPVARYVIALGRLAGGFDAQHLNSPWNFDDTEQNNIASGKFPGAQLLWWSRLPMALLAALSGLLLFTLVRLAAGRVAAYVLLLLYLGNAYLLENLRRAMGESPLLFFTLLAVALIGLAAYQWRGRLGSRRGLIYCAAAGVSGGLAAAAKLTGFGVVAGGVALCFLMMVLDKQAGSPAQRRTWIIRVTALLALTAGITFVAVNPYLYPSPVERTARMLKFRTQEMQDQFERFPQAHIGGLLSRARTLAGGVYRDYATFRWSGSSLLSVVGNFGLFCLGFFVLGRRAWEWLRGQKGSPAGAALMVALGISALPALFSPLKSGDWVFGPLGFERYFLLLVVFSTACIAIGVAAALEALWRAARSSRLSPHHGRGPLSKSIEGR